MKAQLQEEINNRTCKPAFKGLKYLPKPACKHVNDEYLTDKEAVKWLKIGLLKESDFEVLPEAYDKPKKKKKTTKKED